METVQGNTMKALHAIQQFLDENADRLGGIPRSGTRRQLDQAVVDLAAHAVRQTETTTVGRGGTSQARSLRTVLVRDHMQVIAGIAAVDLPITPQLQALRMPKGRPSIELLVTAARAMADAAEPYRNIFIDAGMPGDFLGQLRTTANSCEAQETQRQQVKAKTVGATHGIRDCLRAASRIVTVLDRMVKSALKDDRTLLASWNSVKRVRRVRSQPAVPAVPLPIPAAGAGSTPAVAPEVASPIAA